VWIFIVQTVKSIDQKKHTKHTEFSKKLLEQKADYTNLSKYTKCHDHLMIDTLFHPVVYDI